MLPYLFVLLAIAVRFLPFVGPLNFLPHAWHFTPVAASLLFFGARGSRRQMWIPLVLLAATDVVLTKFIYSYQLTWDQLVTWAWYAAILWLGTNLREKSGPVRVVGAALTSSISFFLVSSFAEHSRAICSSRSRFSELQYSCTRSPSGCTKLPATTSPPRRNWAND